MYSTNSNSPLPESLVSSVRDLIQQYAEEYNDPTEGQPFYLDLLARLAQIMDDQDWQYPLLVKQGVNLGVDEPIPRSPGIWPTKTELHGEIEPEEQPPPPSRHDNYPSAGEHHAAIRATYVEETPHMVEGPYTELQAAQRCRCHVHELCHGALAGKPEGKYLDKLRTIHDASVNMVNKWIQANLVEKTTAPALHDLMTALHILQDEHVTLLKLDVTKAHRRIKVRKRDWKYITAKLGNEVWINKCGTYGVSSAQYYWGRMAALLIRMLYDIYPSIRWAFVYVDDYIFILRADTAPQLMMAIVVTLYALGCPVSWKKTCLGEVNHWLGYQVDTTKITACLTHDKQVLITAILRKLGSGEQQTAAEVRSLAGRLQWATAICLPMRPFLQPLYAWMEAMNSRESREHGKAWGRPPQVLIMLADIMMDLINDEPCSPMPPTAAMHIVAATDAGANDTDATIGGWFSTLREPSKHEVQWFSMPITRDDHPWAYDLGTPQQRIAAMELYATLILMKYITASSTDMDLCLPMVTDNMGNAYAVTDYHCRKWPNSAILMEMALTQYHHRVRAAIKHVHRENNTWADQLTHSDYDGFSQALRISTRPADMQWHVLHKFETFQT